MHDWDFDPDGILAGTCSVERVLRYTFLARACQVGNYAVVKALALPPYSLPMEEWIAQEEDTSVNVCYSCAIGYCYSPQGQFMLDELVKPPWSFDPEIIYCQASWCFRFDNAALFEKIVESRGVSVELQNNLIRKAIHDLSKHKRGLVYVSGTLMLQYTVMTMCEYGPFFDGKLGDPADDDAMYIARLALKRRSYAMFMALNGHANPDSPLALLSYDLVGKIANYMLLSKILSSK